MPGTIRLHRVLRASPVRVYRAFVAHKHELLAHELEEESMTSGPAHPDDDIGDDLLRLIFIACHPPLPTESRVALTGNAGERPQMLARAAALAGR